MSIVEENFCTELQALLDKYKTQISVPRIMGHAQRIFHHTLSIRYHPELHPIATERDYLNKFITEGPKAKIKYSWVEELNEASSNVTCNKQEEHQNGERIK